MHLKFASNIAACTFVLSSLSFAIFNLRGRDYCVDLYHNLTFITRGEGLHVFRVDNAEDIQISFDLASKSKLENKKRAGSQGFTSKLSSFLILFLRYIRVHILEV